MNQCHSHAQCGSPFTTLEVCFSESPSEENRAHSVAILPKKVFHLLKFGSDRNLGHSPQS